MNDFTAQQGWQCPLCKRVYSPFTPCCLYCGAEGMAKTSTDTNSTSCTDWQKQQSITIARYIPQEDNYTSISNDRDTFSTEDIGESEEE